MKRLTEVTQEDGGHRTPSTRGRFALGFQIPKNIKAP